MKVVTWVLCTHLYVPLVVLSSPLSVGVFTCLVADVANCRLVVEWDRGNADVHSSRPDGTYHGASGLYLTLFMWSPVGGSSLGEKGVHDKTPYLGTFRLLFVQFVMPVVPSDGTSTAPNKKGVSPLHFQ